MLLTLKHVALLFAAAALGCSPKAGSGGAGAQSPERQAEAEYDVARDLFFNRREPRQALDHALKAVELDDENPRVLYFVSNIYLSFCSTDAGFTSPDCRLADAESFARRAIKAEGSFRDAKNLLAVILTHQGKFPEAIALLEPLTRDPAYSASHLAWGNLGWAELQAGHVDAAIAALKNAVTQPKFCVGFYRLGMAFEKKGDLNRAEENLSSALSVDAEECKTLQAAWEARGRVRQSLGRAADARADFDRCRELAPGTKEGKQCAKALAQLGTGQLGAGGVKSPPVP